MRDSRTLISGLLISAVLTHTLPSAAQAGTIRCSSNDGHYKYCRVNTNGNAQLIHQLSGSLCQQGYSWGFDYRGVWVDRGCRADFQFGTPQTSNSAGTAIAAGILGAIIVGAIASNDDDGHRDQQTSRRDFYRDGYRMGQRDWNYGKPPYYLAYKSRFPSAYEGIFARGYDDGYNNRHGSGDRYDESRYYDSYDSYAAYSHTQIDVRPRKQARAPQPGSADYGTINNPNHGAGPPEPGDDDYGTIDNPNHGAGPQ
jgi:hypothetical protein